MFNFTKYAVEVQQEVLKAYAKGKTVVFSKEDTSCSWIWVTMDGHTAYRILKSEVIIDYLSDKFRHMDFSKFEEGVYAPGTDLDMTGESVTIDRDGKKHVLDRYKAQEGTLEVWVDKSITKLLTKHSEGYTATSAVSPVYYYEKSTFECIGIACPVRYKKEN